MSDQENPLTAGKQKSSPKPFIAFLLVIVIAGGAIAAGMLWFTNRPIEGEDTAAFLPPDTKVAIHIRGLNELVESVKVWGSDSDAIAILNEMMVGFDLSGMDKALEYCKTQIRGDCRLLIASRVLPHKNSGLENSAPILMLEGREHQALISFLSKSSSAVDVKIEDLGEDIKKVILSATTSVFLTNRGPFIAASESLENIQALAAAKENPYQSTSSARWLSKWSAEPFALMIDMPSWQEEITEGFAKMEASMAKVDATTGPASKDISTVLASTGRELVDGMRGGFVFFDLSPEGMGLRVVADVKDDSPFGKSLKKIATAKPDMALLGKLPRDYALYTGSTPELSQLEPLVDLQQAIQSTVLGGKMEIDVALFEGLKQSAAGTSFVFGQGISQIAVYEYEEPKKVLASLSTVYEAMTKSDVYKQAGLSMKMEQNAGEYAGIKFHKITTDLGLQEMGSTETGAMIGMLLGDGVLTQWVGADDQYLYQMISPQLEDIGKVFEQFKTNEPGVGASTSFKNSLNRMGSPLLAGGLIDIESLIAPFAMFLAPGLITPGEEPNYLVMAVSAPEQALSLDVWLPKPLFDNLVAVGKKVAGTGLGGDQGVPSGFDMGGDLGDDYDGVGDEYGADEEAPFEIEETP